MESSFFLNGHSFFKMHTFLEIVITKTELYLLHSLVLCCKIDSWGWHVLKIWLCVSFLIIDYICISTRQHWSFNFFSPRSISPSIKLNNQLNSSGFFFLNSMCILMITFKCWYYFEIFCWEFHACNIICFNQICSPFSPLLPILSLSTQSVSSYFFKTHWTHFLLHLCRWV